MSDAPDDAGEGPAEGPIEAAPAPSAPAEPVEPKLPRRSFGRSKELVSQLGLGTWGLSGDAYGPVYHKEVDRVIDRAIELGFTVFDTADVYGDGKMEEQLGKKLDPNEHMLITKIGTFPGPKPAAPTPTPAIDGAIAKPASAEAVVAGRKNFDPENLQKAFDASRKRIGRDRLDVVLLHNPSLAALEDGACVEWLRERVKADELRYWGVSCGNADIAKKAIERRADAIELAYNIFHQKDLHSIADEAASTETAVIARSVLAHGLLAGHWPKTKVFFDNDHRSKRWSKEDVQYRIDQLTAVRQLVAGDVLTLRSAALRFVLSNHLVTTAVLGPRSVTQLNQLVHEAGKGPVYLDEDALSTLPPRLEAVGIEL